MRKSYLLFIIICLLHDFACVAEAKEVDADLGMKLADAAWREPVKDSEWRGVDPETDKPIPPPRIKGLYKLLAEKSKNGFLVYRFPANVYYDLNLELAVNTHTGDVWDMYTCEHLSNPALRRMQVSIKSSLNSAEKKQYDQLRRLRPWNAGIVAACKMKQLDVESGDQLVELAITGTPNQGAGFRGTPENRHEMFLVYQILGKYEGTAAWLAINPWTGDVWDMNECTLLFNPALSKAQTKIKAQFHGEELKEYEHLHNIKPYREYDLESCP